MEVPSRSSGATKHCPHSDAERMLAAREIRFMARLEIVNMDGLSVDEALGQTYSSGLMGLNSRCRWNGMVRRMPLIAVRRLQRPDLCVGCLAQPRRILATVSSTG